MAPRRGRLAVLLVSLVLPVLFILGVFFAPAGDAKTSKVTVHALSATAPAVAKFTNLKLQTYTVMQSFAYDATHHVWFFVQVPPGGHVADGNLIITKVSSTGKNLGYMKLTKADHGVAIAVEPRGADSYLYTGYHPTSDGFGVGIASFRYVNTPSGGASLNLNTAAGVTRYGVNASFGAFQQTPQIDLARGLIAINYRTGDPVEKHSFHLSVYTLANFKARNYVSISRTNVPYELTAGYNTNGNFNPDLYQGWTFNAASFAWLTGTGYDPVNNPAGNAKLGEFLPTTNPTVTSRVPVTAGSNLTYREPEGASALPNGNVCVGFASGPSGARLANVYCQTAA